MLKKIQDYQLAMEDIRAEFTTSYFDPGQLIEQIQQRQQQIQSLLTSDQQVNQKVSLRDHHLTQKLKPHSQRENHHLSTPLPNYQHLNFSSSIKQCIKPNTQLQMSWIFKELLPVTFKNKKQPFNLATKELSFSLHHLECRSRIQGLKMGKNHRLTTVSEPILKAKNELKIQHTVRPNNFHLITNLLNSEFIYMYCQTSSNIVIGHCVLQFGELLGQRQSEVYLNFRNHQQDLFSIKADFRLQISTLSPEIDSFTKKQDKKKKILCQGEERKSRSPSPRVKKTYAKKIVAENTRNFVVLDQYPNIIQFCTSETEEKPVYESLENISKKQIVINENELDIKVQLKNPKIKGKVQFTLGKEKFLLTVSPNQLFKVFTAQESRHFFKDNEDAYQRNSIIQLTPQIYIFPDIDTKVVRNPIEQHGTREHLNLYFLKTEVEVLEIQMPPQVNFYYREADGGYMIYYIVGKGADKGHIPISIVAKSRLKKYRQFHYFNYIMKDFSIDLNLQLDVSGSGIYQLDVGSILKFKHKYRIRSCREDMVRVITSDISDFYDLKYILLQVLVEREKMEVILMIDDLEKHHTATLDLLVVQRDRKVNWGFM